MVERLTRKPRRVRLDEPQSERPAEKTGPDAQPPVRLVDRIEHLAIQDLKVPARSLRSCSDGQVRDLMGLIRTVGFIVPLVIDEECRVWAGMVRLKAAERLGMVQVPVVRLANLTEAQKRAFRIADNKLQEKGKWDRKQLSLELPELTPLLQLEDLDISITGFTAVEIDQITFDFEEDAADPSDDFDPDLLSQPVVSRLGDVYRLGDHILGCGDARDQDLVRRLVGNRLAAMAFLDVPYNERIRNVVGRGRTKHAEFAMASGEMSDEEYRDFLRQTLSVAAAVSTKTALHYACTNWSHVDALIAVGHQVYSAMINLAVWVKPNAGQGQFYRSQHELIGIFRVGEGRHLNNVENGKHGRNRSNVWQYSGTSGFRAGRMADLRAHPTVKPVAMVCDAIKDCTRRDDTVLDTFIGSGTTILAAERVGRRAVGVEIEPRFVDLAIRRWQQMTGRDAIHVEDGRTFLDLTSERAAS
jgi:DNA modification methylase